MMSVCIYSEKVFGVTTKSIISFAFPGDDVMQNKKGISFNEIP